MVTIKTIQEEMFSQIFCSFSLGSILMGRTGIKEDTLAKDESHKKGNIEKVTTDEGEASEDGNVEKAGAVNVCFVLLLQVECGWK